MNEIIVTGTVVSKVNAAEYPDGTKIANFYVMSRRGHHKDFFHVTASGENASMCLLGLAPADHVKLTGHIETGKRIVKNSYVVSGTGKERKHLVLPTCTIQLANFEKTGK